MSFSAVIAEGLPEEHKKNSLIKLSFETVAVTFPAA